jgi:hypothetical protein
MGKGPYGQRRLTTGRILATGVTWRCQEERYPASDGASKGMQMVFRAKAWGVRELKGDQWMGTSG